jgi:hypothetical protein
MLMSIMTYPRCGPSGQSVCQVGDTDRQSVRSSGKALQQKEPDRRVQDDELLNSRLYLKPDIAWEVADKLAVVSTRVQS